jgi:hypothetical protein
VRYVGIFDPLNVSGADTTAFDIPISAEHTSFVQRSRSSWEISLWEAFAEIPESYNVFVDHVREFRPDVIQFEEPYLWPIVRKLKRDGFAKNAIIVHSSYNFETNYRKELAELTGTFDSFVLESIAKQEQEIALNVDLVVAVSDTDKECFTRLGAKNVVVARNGGQLPSIYPDKERAIQQYLHDQPFALFVSSAHPPNAQGFIDFVTNAPMETFSCGSLIVCGSVHKLLIKTPHYLRQQGVYRATKFLGFVSSDLLHSFYHLARVILLPKTRGGGSNLKTAEALLSGQPIVATSHAFVGFEPYHNLPNVWIEDDPFHFWKRVRELLAKPTGRLDPADMATRRELEWQACLVPLVKSVENAKNELAT